MSTSENNGSLIASGVPPTNLAELLWLVDRSKGTEEGMMHSVAVRFLEFIKATPEQVSIDTLHDKKESFISFLKAGKYKPASVKSYRNYLNRLLLRAATAGWVRVDDALSPEWKPIADLIAGGKAKRIVLYAVRIGRCPKDLTEEDLAAWQQERVASGHSLQKAVEACSELRGVIAKNGLSANFPGIRQPQTRYGVLLTAMHPQLRREIEEVLDWKQSDFQLDRPANAHVRPISARNLRDQFQQITGYVQNVARKPEVTSIADLMTRANIGGYVTWGKNTRGLKGHSMVVGLGRIYAALRHHPSYKTLDLSWLDGILNQIPVEPQSTIDQRKAKKFISYAEAEQIPARIHAQRIKLKDQRQHTQAIYVRNELLMLWLLLLPWRQKNIRDCRIGGNNPNLFKAPIPPFCRLTKPSWIEEQERLAPGGRYWQFHFTPDETKTKGEVNAFVPSELISLLEEYLTVYRPALLRDNDPGTLFFNDAGKRMDTQDVDSLVKQLASFHTGVPVTPHLFRDIVVYEWLSTHPEDYLTVSKLLWHRNINTTLKIYGRRFDESTGVARMDDWRMNRVKSAA